MRLEFEDSRLALVLTESAAETKLSVPLIKAARRQLQKILAANDERDLREVKSLHYEKLKGNRSGERSIRLNKQWRLILRIEDDASPPKVVVVGIEDYH